MSIIETLRAEQSDLQARLSQVEKLIQEYLEWEARVNAVVSSHEVSHDAPQHLDNSPKPSADDQPITPISDFEDAVREALSEASDPRNRTDLLSDLVAKGIIVGGTDPRNTLSARLSRMSSDVVNVKGKGYWLKARAYEPTGYVGAEDPVPEDSNGEDLDDLRIRSEAKENLPPHLREIFD